MEGERRGEQLVVKAGRPYEPSAQDLAWLEKQSKLQRAILLSNLANDDEECPSTDPGNEPQPKPQRKTPPQQVGAAPGCVAKTGNDQ